MMIGGQRKNMWGDLMNPIDLSQENARLNELAEIDWLTGIYNRGTSEKKINELLSQHQRGILFVLDGDHLKRINDRYGHTAGDCLLKEMAKVLRYMLLKQDILGRIGGDEFVIFMPSDQDMDFALEKSRKIAERIRDIRLQQSGTIRVSVTIGVSLCEPGDDYRSLFDRADQRLIAAKRHRKEGCNNVDNIKWLESAAGGIAIDMKLISDDLTEQGCIPGAFCQDYEMFKVIYRFIARRLQRTKGSSYLILLTLTDKVGDFPPLLDREEQMALLGDVIQVSLRLGDVFTQYSSCQFLLMVPDATEKESDRISMRIHDSFFARNPCNTNRLLLHRSYPILPAMPEKPSSPASKDFEVD
ncbi:MAG: GGDEF domain-containing protein [Evtepia sp.]